MSHDDPDDVMPQDDRSMVAVLEDGELPEPEAASLRERLAQDRELQQAQARLRRLTALSKAALRAPVVSVTEWRALSERVLADAAAGVARHAEARIISFRRSILRFAVAAAFLLAGTLVLPLLGGPSGRLDAGGLPIARAPGANDFEVLEAWGETKDYYIWLDYPSEPSDAVVIMVSRT